MHEQQQEDLEPSEKPALGLHRIAFRYPWTVVLLATALAAVGGYVYLFHLEIRTDRSSLANPDLEINRRYQHYQDQFGGDSNYLVLVLSAGQPGSGDSLPPLPDIVQRSAMKRLASAWADSLRKRPDLFPRVLDRVDPEELGGLGLLYLPFDAFEKAVTGLQEYLPDIRAFASAPSLDSFLNVINEKLSTIAPPPDSSAADRQQLRSLLDGLEGLFSSLHRTLDGSAEAALPDLEHLASSGSFDPDGFFFTPDGRVLTAFAAVTDRPEQRNRYEPVMAYALAALHNALAGDSTGVAGGLAGYPALEYEEATTSQRDFTRGTIIALIAVSLLFVWGFRSIFRPALAALCLCFSIAITFGAAWLLVGHMNMLAMVFAIILVALGIDFALHFFTHYRQGFVEGLQPTAAVTRTYRTIGSALWMGGLTTAGAFLSAYFTDFIGLSELGIIAGVGLLICLISMYFVFPALLFLFDSRFPYDGKQIQPTRGASISNRIQVNRKLRIPENALLGVILLLAGLGFGLGQYDFDTNLLNLQPVEGDASKWQKVLLSTDDRTSFAIQIFDDRDSLERMRNAFDASPLVLRTESVFPSHEAQRRVMLAPVCQTFTEIAVTPPQTAPASEIRRQLFRMRQTIRQFRNASAQADAALAGLDSEIEASFRLLRERSEEQSSARLTQFNRKFQRTIGDAVETAKTYFCPPPLNLDDLPDAIRGRFVGKDGSFALMVYPAINTWNGENLETFVEELRAIDPTVFGGVINFYENALSMIESFIDAALYSFIAILVLLLAWTRSFKATLLALIPLITSAGILLGIMAWTPKPILWNFANFFSVPILIGIGVAGGIHLVRAWQLRSLTVFRDAMSAVLYSALTTMIGFGILAMSEHQGVASLGLILFIGITLNLMICMMILPFMLRILDPWKAEEPKPH